MDECPVYLIISILILYDPGAEMIIDISLPALPLRLMLFEIP